MKLNPKTIFASAMGGLFLSSMVVGGYLASAPVAITAFLTKKIIIAGFAFPLAIGVLLGAALLCGVMGFLFADKEESINNPDEAKAAVEKRDAAKQEVLNPLLQAYEKAYRAFEPLSRESESEAKTKAAGAFEAAESELKKRLGTSQVSEGLFSLLAQGLFAAGIAAICPPLIMSVPALSALFISVRLLMPLKAWIAVLGTALVGIISGLGRLDYNKAVYAHSGNMEAKNDRDTFNDQHVLGVFSLWKLHKTVPALFCNPTFDQSPATAERPSR